MPDKRDAPSPNRGRGVTYYIKHYLKKMHPQDRYVGTRLDPPAPSPTNPTQKESEQKRDAEKQAQVAKRGDGWKTAHRQCFTGGNHGTESLGT